MCDQISDAVLDECIRQDKMSRVACETAVGTGFAMVFGEITTKANVNYEKIIKDTNKKNWIHKRRVSIYSRKY